MTYSLIFLMTLLSVGYPTTLLISPLASVQDSHIQGNTPSNFAQVLKRDLLKHFQAPDDGSITVEYEMLRDIATQSGVALPKYYIWVKMYGQEGIVAEGAVKVAAIAKKKFEVLDYLSIADLAKSPERINQVFPIPIGDKIRARLSRTE
ncbi:MAG: hypothetical protein AUK48_02355 [Oscillatoriales cyanobacterium CG2_30_44_21]|nr:MAG: hypothetical protein AUK48_02355 [Oscillatoriales cyanobacterium CG2_30_44_21]